MKKLLIIMNPCSGKKRANGHLADIISVFNRANYEVTVFMTTARGDATTIAAQKGADYDLLVCIGGDGTFNEVITGLHNMGCKTPIGYIPAGSTNDFANSLHLSKDIQNRSPYRGGRPVRPDRQVPSARPGHSPR